MCVRDGTPSLPSLVESVSTSDGCVPRTSDGGSRGCSQRLPMPDHPGAVSGIEPLHASAYNSKRNSPLLSVALGAHNGVHKARDGHGADAVPRRSCGSLDVARQVQQITATCQAASPMGPQVIPSAGDQELLMHGLTSPERRADAAVQSHVVPISPFSTAEDSPTAPRASTFGSTPMHESHASAGPLHWAEQDTGTQQAALLARTAQHSMDACGGRSSDVSEGRASTSTTVFGSPVLISEVMQGQNPGSAPPIPEGRVVHAAEQSKGQTIAFMSSLFQPAQNVPKYPCTQRGGIPQCAPLPAFPSEARWADSIEVQRVHRGPQSPACWPCTGDTRQPLGERASRFRATEEEPKGCRHRNHSSEARRSPRTSSDPVVCTPLSFARLPTIELLNCCKVACSKAPTHACMHGRKFEATCANEDYGCAQGRPSMDASFESDLEMRVARSRQTMDFAARQRTRFGSLSCGQLSIMEGLSLLETLPRHAPSRLLLSFLSAQLPALLCAR
jgi:hypothetical protein